MLVQTGDRDGAADHQQLREGAPLHPVQPDAVLVPGRARRDRAALHAARAAPALQDMGLSGDAAGVHGHHALDALVSRDRQAGAVAAGPCHDAGRFGAVWLLDVEGTNPHCLGRTITGAPNFQGKKDMSITVHISRTAALVVAALLLAAPARAADPEATPNDMAHFLAGMPPAADFAVGRLHQGALLAAARPQHGQHLALAQQSPGLAHPGLVEGQSADAATDHLLHVQRS